MESVRQRASRGKCMYPRTQPGGGPHVVVEGEAERAQEILQDGRRQLQDLLRVHAQHVLHQTEVLPAGQYKSTVLRVQYESTV